MPVLASSLRIAGAGPIPMYFGSTPATAQPTRRPSGLRPFAFATASDATTQAAAPSQMPLALPAVTRPSFLKYGASFARPSSVVFGRMCSSARNGTIWRVFGSFTWTAITSSSKAPPSHARLASCCERRANSSTSRRVSWYFSARFSAVCAMEKPHCGSVSDSHSRSSSGAGGPSLRPQRAPRTTCGAWLMDSPPPASTTFDSSSRICCAACAMASKPEPHSRFTVSAGTSMGSPALRPTWRAK